MMADLMHHDMGDERFERHAGFDPFVEQRAAEKMHGRRQVAGLRLLPEGTAAIEAGQAERIVNLHLLQDIGVGEILDQHHDIGEIGTEGLGQAAQGLQREYLDFLWGRGEAERLTSVRHGCHIGERNNAG